MFPSVGSTFSVGEEGKISAWGMNKDGELGIGDKKPRNSPTLVLETEIVLPVKKIMVSKSTSLILDNNGTLWGSGKSIDYTTVSFTVVPGFPKEISHLSGCQTDGIYQVAVTTTEGDVWVQSDENYYGQCGLENANIPFIPTLIPGLPPIRRTSCGQEFMIMEDVEGNLYSCGSNNEGQLGLGLEVYETVSVPTLIKKPEGMAKGSLQNIHAGTNFSLVLDSDGMAWTCGKITSLGRRGDCKVFKKVDGMPPLVSIDAAAEHTLALDENGDAWGWGSNYLFQIFPRGVEINDHEPKKYTFPESIIYVYAGGHHSFFETLSGEIWGFGYNGYGQLGIGLDYSRMSGHSPTLVPIRVSHPNRRKGIKKPLNESDS